MFQMMVGRLDSEGFRSTPKTCWRFPYVLTLR
jgi:hypothetical protein